MDLQAINAYLTKIRAEKAADLKPCGLVTDRFIQSPPHSVGVAHLILRPRMLLGDPTGTGKTPQALVAYAYLKEKAQRLKGLVVTTQSAQFQWVRAVDKFLAGVSASVIGYERYPHTFVNLGPAGRAQQWPTLMGTDLWVTTYAMAVKELPNLLTGLDQFVLFLDEAQALKSHKGEVQYPAVLKLSQKARAVWALTATPMMNDRLDELYSIMELVRPGTFGDYSKYRKTYYKLELVKPKWKTKKVHAYYKIKGYQNLALLRSQVDPFFLRRPVHDFQQYLPPVSFQQLDVPLDPKQRALYSEIIGKHWPVSRTPLQQLAALTYAQMAVDSPTVLGFPSVPSAKTTELLRLLDEALSDQQVIIYAKFAKVVTWLSGILRDAKIAHGVIAGPVSAAKRDEVAQAFQRGELPVVLITSAGAQALDLQAASTIICYDLPWSWGEFRQIIGRARRIGSQHAGINTILLCGSSTIDDVVANRLTKKEEYITAVLGSVDTEARLSDRERIKMVSEDADEITLPEGDLTDLFRSVAA